jgi:O-antigen/teichoic acid export membrane protein
MSPEPSGLPVQSKAGDSVGQRLLRGLGATALSPIVTVFTQLVTIPVLLHVWGATKYGEWLVLSAIPSYLTFSDLGFGDASGSDMSLRVAQNDREGALETFQSAWILVTCVSLVALVLASLLMWWIPWQGWLRLSGLSSLESAKIILVLGVYVCVSQQYGVVESGYRSDGHFATGTFWILIQRLTETIAATAVAILGGSLLAVACTYLVARCLGTIAYSILLCRLSPWIQFGIRHARIRTIKRLVAPAAGFMAFPLGYAISLQGFTVLIGALLGPVAVVSFSTLRTLSRLILQLTTVIKHALWPELSRAFGQGNLFLARKLNRIAWQASLGISVLGGMFLWVMAPYIYRVWLRHDVNFDAACFHVLLLVAVVNSLWDIGAVIPMSVNGHFRTALLYSGAALLSLGLAWVLLPGLGAVGAAIALAVMDGVMTIYVLRTALEHTKDTLKNFVTSLFTLSSFRRALQIAPSA